MEEKERYEIHIYDDICVDLYDNGVLDKSINDTYKLEELLNQQSKRLKELEQENQQLKQSQNQKAIEVLEKVKEKILSYEEIYYQFLESGAKVPVVCLENFRVKQTIDNQINELKGKVEDVKD